ncbi:hypothetical protein HN011_008785, partial [Eciton burchellii]
RYSGATPEIRSNWRSFAARSVLSFEHHLLPVHIRTTQLAYGASQLHYTVYHNETVSCKHITTKARTGTDYLENEKKILEKKEKLEKPNISSMLETTPKASPPPYLQRLNLKSLRCRDVAHVLCTKIDDELMNVSSNVSPNYILTHDHLGRNCILHEVI